MSLLSLKRREHAVVSSSGMNGVASTLADLPAGSVARIIDVCDDAQPATARRLVDLGFAPGAQVSVVRKAPLADPVIFRVAGAELALRRCQARCIYVRVEAGDRTSAG